MSKLKNKKDIIYITIILILVAVVTVLSVCILLNQTPQDSTKPNADNSNSSLYYTPTDPYEIPNRSEEDIKNMYENEIMIFDIYARVNLPFTMTTSTIDKQYPDKIKELIGIEDSLPYVKYLSYSQSLWTESAAIDNEGNIGPSGNADTVPFLLIAIDCVSEQAARDVASELRETMPKDMFAPKYVFDDMQIKLSAGNKVWVCMMMSDSKRRIGISAEDVMNNAMLYMQTYDGRYSDKQPK